MDFVYRLLFTPLLSCCSTFSFVFLPHWVPTNSLLLNCSLKSKRKSPKSCIIRPHHEWVCNLLCFHIIDSLLSLLWQHQSLSLSLLMRARPGTMNHFLISCQDARLHRVKSLIKSIIWEESVFVTESDWVRKLHSERLQGKISLATGQGAICIHLLKCKVTREREREWKRVSKCLPRRVN